VSANKPPLGFVFTALKKIYIILRLDVFNVMIRNPYYICEILQIMSLLMLSVDMQGFNIKCHEESKSIPFIFLLKSLKIQ
jgi:hypothetical protein